MKKKKYFQFSGFLGSAGQDPNDPESTYDKLFGNLEKMKEIVEKVHKQMKDPVNKIIRIIFQTNNLQAKTTFVAVCIPEFLSLYETERLIQELAKFKIDVHNIVVNQVLFPGLNNI